MNASPLRPDASGPARPDAFDTRAVHAGRGDLRDLGVHALPLDLSTTYPLGAGGLDEATASLDALCAGAGDHGGADARRAPGDDETHVVFHSDSFY